MSDIRTPRDEVRKPGYFYPPFREGWTYQGATYAGHSDYSVDWNRRTKDGGWLDDRGDPVLSAARGTVVEVDVADGYALVQHFRGTYRTEYRHMQPVLVKPGQKVNRGTLLGRIGEAGNAPNGTHLHHVHHRKSPKGVWNRIKQSFYGVPVTVSVGDSDTRPPTWSAPDPVYVVGPPKRATWESAYHAAAAALEACETRCPETEEPA